MGGVKVALYQKICMKTEQRLMYHIQVSHYLNCQLILSPCCTCITNKMLQWACCKINLRMPFVKFAGVAGQCNKNNKFNLIFCNKSVKNLCQPALEHQTTQNNFYVRILGQFYNKIFMLRLN